MAGAFLLPLIAGGLEAFGQLSEADNKAQALRDEADAETLNAALARRVAKYNAERQQTIATQKIGEVVAGYAASGVAQNSGSVLDILRQSHTNAELDRLNILHEGDMRAYNALSRSRALRSQASDVKSSGAFGALISAFSGGAKAYDRYGRSSDNAED